MTQSENGNFPSIKHCSNCADCNTDCSCHAPLEQSEPKTIIHVNCDGKDCKYPIFVNRCRCECCFAVGCNDCSTKDMESHENCPRNKIALKCDHSTKDISESCERHNKDNCQKCFTKPEVSTWENRFDEKFLEWTIYKPNSPAGIKVKEFIRNELGKVENECQEALRQMNEAYNDSLKDELDKARKEEQERIINVIKSYSMEWLEIAADNDYVDGHKATVYGIIKEIIESGNQ